MTIQSEIYTAIKDHFPQASGADALDRAMRQTVQAGGYMVPGGRALFMEVIDTTTGLVWMSAAPVQLEDFEALVLDESLVKVGIARAPMDSSAFQYSPAEPDAAVRERIIDGRLYINVAAPGERTPPMVPGGPMQIAVDKAHVIGFEAGRSVAILSLPEGDFVELVGDASADQALVLPEGGQLQQIELSQPWVVTLPTPTQAFFWFSNGMRSFQGPVTLPEQNQ